MWVDVWGRGLPSAQALLGIFGSWLAKAQGKVQ